MNKKYWQVTVTLRDGIIHFIETDEPNLTESDHVGKFYKVNEEVMRLDCDLFATTPELMRCAMILRDAFKLSGKYDIKLLNKN